MLKYAMSLGSNIRKARKRAGMSQVELGLACGWDESPQSRVSNYENDRREPSISDLRAIASATVTTVMALLDDCDTTLSGRIAERFREIPPEQHDKILKALDLLLQQFDLMKEMSPEDTK